VDTNVPRRNPSCAGLTGYYGLPAHTAPLGLTFAPLASLPADLAGSAFVSLHGSWNHSSGVGYKVMRIPFADGTPQPAEDFVAGWLGEGRGPQGAWGRPVDIQDGLDGALYLSDDRAGAIYRIAPVS
jgi:glucose/arabinose dehydrogenase